MPVSTALIWRPNVDEEDRSDHSAAQGHGRHTETYRGQQYTVDFTPRVKLEVVVSDSRADRAIRVIAMAARTGRDDSGTIAVSSLEDTVSIESGQHGAEQEFAER